MGITLHKRVTRCRIAGCVGVALTAVGTALAAASYGRRDREQIYLAGLTCLLGASSAGLAALTIGAREQQELDADQLRRIGAGLLVTMRDDLEPYRQRRSG